MKYDKTLFVFGSNLAGRHGKGAALFARQHWGAEYGVGEGVTGDSYALPTKDENMKVRPLHKIKESYITMRYLAYDNPNWLFLLTPVGTGLAGYEKTDILDFIQEFEIPSNIVFTKEWFE